MPTVKDIAEMAGISPSTVSIVLTGKAQQRQISRRTQERIWEAARALGYLPNVSARSLRSAPDAACFYILLFWAEDSRISMLARFLQGVQRAFASFEHPCELLLDPYFNSKLSASMSERVMSLCHGAIVCNADEDDMAFLHEKKIEKPVVLYNRHSEIYHTVIVDDAKIGIMAADVFASHNRKVAAVLTLEKGFGGHTSLRTIAFAKRCEELGLRIAKVTAVENSMRGGYSGIRNLLDSRVTADCLFCASDTIALGAVKALNEFCVRIPEEIEIISTGNGDPQQEEFAVPSLSVINVPIDEMAEQCMGLLYKQLTYVSANVDSITLPTNYIPRESCPPKYETVSGS